MGRYIFKDGDIVKEKILNFIRENRDKKWMLFTDQLIFRFQDDKVSSIGSQLTYYLVLSIFPFLIFLLNIVKFTPLASQDVLNQLVSVLPGDTQTMLIDIVNSIIGASNNALLSISAITGLWTASAGIAAVLKALNEAYDYKEERNFLQVRLTAVLFTLGLMILIILVFGFLIFGEIIARNLFSLISGGDLFKTIWPILRIVIALVFMILGFGLLYKFGPSFPEESNVTFKDTLPGSIFVSIGWAIASVLFAFYVNNFGKYSVTYGSLGGIIIFLIWLYISSIIIVLGGEVNATIDYFKKNGWKYEPDKSFIRDIILSLAS